MGHGKRRTTFAAAISILTVASLGFLLWNWLAGPPATAAGSTARVSGLATEVHDAEWVDFDMGHVMDGQGGFMMPDQMMPGAPSGEEVRLGVTVTLSNPGRDTRGFDLLEEFTVTGGGLDEARPLSADTIGELGQLGPGSALDGTLYFDIEVPEPDGPPLYLHWQREGDEVRIPIQLPGEAPDHDDH